MSGVVVIVLLLLSNCVFISISSYLCTVKSGLFFLNISHNKFVLPHLFAVEVLSKIYVRFITCS